MDRPLRKAEHDYGLGDLGVIRYGMIYCGHAAWLILGACLFLYATWPSTCTPGDVLEVYACAGRLPESGRWIEAALLTWLWSTPLIALMEISLRLARRAHREVDP